MTFDEEPEEEAGEGAAWMATFADLMSLLLTFFVLLLSFANMDVVRFRVVLGSVRDAFGVQFEHPGEIEAVSSTILNMSMQESTKNIKIMEEIAQLEKVKEVIKEAGMEGLMEAELSDRGMVIRIKGQVLFSSGEASLKKEATKALAPVVQLILTMKHQLAIEGHTDDRPIHTKKFPSNWELSTARAVATMRYLVERGLDTQRVNVSGYADMRPVGDNETEEGRAKNRRVEFVFLRSPDEEPISTEEIEAAKREMERMKKARNLVDDQPDVTSGADFGAAPVRVPVIEGKPDVPSSEEPPETSESDAGTENTLSEEPKDSAPGNEAAEGAATKDDEPGTKEKNVGVSPPSSP